MLLLDVNVLVHSFRADAPRHDEYRAWLTDVVNGDGPFAVSTLALSGFLRVATHPKVFDPPSPLQDALAFAKALRQCPAYVQVDPGPRHWSIFTDLCQASAAKGNLIPDAYFAALAIESGCTWVTTDRDYSRFPGLRWRHPLG